MVEQDTLRMIDGEVKAIHENKYNEILGDMYDTITEDKLLTETERREVRTLNNLDEETSEQVETSMQMSGGYRFHGINTQFKQVSLNTTRNHWRRRYKLGTRP